MRDLDLKTIIGALVGLAIGLGVGLFFAWMVWPVEWKGAYPNELRPEFKRTYVALVAAYYPFFPEIDPYQLLPNFKADELSRIFGELTSEEARRTRPLQVQQVQALATRMGIKPGTVAPTTPVAGTPAPGQTPLPAATPAPAASAGLLSNPLLLVLGGVVLLVVVGGVGLFLMRQRGRVTAPVQRGLRPLEERAGEPSSREATRRGLAEPSLGHFVTTYTLGDDGYDTSFSIETAGGEFRGECGVGISEVIGQGPPQQVTAFEVWLFDKNDIKTVTKVLMSDHAYNNEAIRKKLAPRGDPVLAQRGKIVTLETESLRVDAEIVDMAYGSGGTPQSFFSKLSMALVPTVKEAVLA